MVNSTAISGVRETKMQGTKRWCRLKIETTDKYHFFCGTDPNDERPPFDLKDEFKAMRGSKWMSTDDVPAEQRRPVWRVENCRRNNFNIDYLEGKNPFARYKTPLDATKFNIPVRRKDQFTGEVRELFAHQIEYIAHILQRKQCIISGEMGTCKTLSAFMARELSLVPDCWYVAPKSALSSVRLEAMRWGVTGKMTYMTYDELKTRLANWKAGDPPPKMVIFDESSRVKTGTSQRSQAAMYLAESMRDTYGDDAYIVLMSGSPAPKSPLDWYQQCEIACPGYIREGDIKKFHRRLAIMESTNDTTGFAWSKQVAWRDGNVNVCNLCGLNKALPCACKGKSPLCTLCRGVGIINQHKGKPHNFQPIDNQIELLYKRFSGLVMVKFKKDCLDLPEKIYRPLRLKPSRDMLSAARILTAKARSVIESMTLLRELSDGFQYKEVVEKTAMCGTCKGASFLSPREGVVESCNMCSGTGVQSTIKREVIEVPSPKLDALSDLLDENEEIGRLVVYAGFTGSIDRICAHVKKMGWEYIRVDGRGWSSSIPSITTDIAMLQAFQNRGDVPIVFVGHPGSAGMGITLTAASMIVYYSNDFNAESRIQSEDRIHRAGMDVNRGATIVDLILLPTDQKVLDNLSRKRELQSISLGEIAAAIDNYSFTGLV